jgi:hypothetical protein
VVRGRFRAPSTTGARAYLASSEMTSYTWYVESILRLQLCTLYTPYCMDKPLPCQS